jgi:hypothetical protein
MNRKLNHAFVSLMLMYSATAWSEEARMATIEGQDQYQLSGSPECSEENSEATSIVKPGERFIASSCDEKDCQVYLKSGINGTIPRNRIHLLPDEPLARLNFESCKKEWRKLQSEPIKKTDVVAYHAAKYNGVPNYYRTLVQASEGNAKAFRQLTSFFPDGEAGDEHELNMTWTFLHVAGDDTFAKLLRQVPEARKGYAATFSSASYAPISNLKPYIQLHFPKTYALLYGK